MEPDLVVAPDEQERERFEAMLSAKIIGGGLIRFGVEDRWDCMFVKLTYEQWDDFVKRVGEARDRKADS